jgi:hypothetical protein
MFAPITEPLPDEFADIIDVIPPYEANGGWQEFGATAGPWTVARNITTASYNIQQTTTAVLERITEVVRAVTVNVAEIRPDILRMIEEGVAVDSTVGGVGRTKVTFGNIEDLTQYRMAFFGRRSKAQGVVDEGATERGRIWCYVAYRANLQAENVSFGFAEGDLANANVTFRLYPEAGQPAGEEHGFWLAEDAGTIA